MRKHQVPSSCSAVFLFALLLAGSAPSQTPDTPAIARFSLTNLPGNSHTGNVDFNALLASPGADVPNFKVENARLTTDPPSQVHITAISPRVGHAESLVIEFEGSLGSANSATICFDDLRFRDGRGIHGLCSEGIILTPDNLSTVQAGLLQGLVRSSSPMVRRNTRVTQTILDPSTVSDAYGARIAKKFVVFQVTVANKSLDYEFLVHDVSVRFPFTLPPAAAAGQPTKDSLKAMNIAPTPDSSGIVNCDGTAGVTTACIELSSLDLSILQGVAERGSYTDTRNLVLRALTAAGTIAAGLQGVTDFGLSFAPAIAAFNGPLLTAYREMFPDYTINQLNRLNARAYKANTVVAKNQAGVIAVFVPQAILMSREDSKTFQKDPHTIMRQTTFTHIKILVDGMFITSADALAPSMSNVTFVADPAKAESDKPELKGFILGSALSDVKIDVGSGAPKGMHVSIDGTPSESRLDFTLKSDGPIQPNTWVEITTTKGTATARSSGLISYQAAAPTASFDKTTGVVGTSVDITMTGTGFFGDTTTVTTPSGSNIKVSKLKADKETPATKMTFTLAIDSSTKPSHYAITVKTPVGSVVVDFEVKPK